MSVSNVYLPMDLPTSRSFDKHLILGTWEIKFPSSLTFWFFIFVHVHSQSRHPPWHSYLRRVVPYLQRQSRVPPITKFFILFCIEAFNQPSLVLGCLIHNVVVPHQPLLCPFYASPKPTPKKSCELFHFIKLGFDNVCVHVTLHYVQ